MRSSKIGLLALAMGSIAGCAGDNPDNVPLYGEWEMTTRVTSLTVDGNPIPASRIPQQIRDMEKAETICGEPMFSDQDWQEDDINSRIPGSCTFEQYDVTPTFVSGRGRCSASAMQAQFDPVLGLGITQSEQAYRMELILEGTAQLPGRMGNRYVRAVAVQQGKRLGDC
ncbi:MAG: DUF3617 family protein [Erythrobacter sp.]